MKWIKWNFINTKIMLPDGRMVRKTHGIPSGSYFTSLVGSLANAVICEFLMNIMNIRIDDSRFLGDDSCLFIHNTYRQSFDIASLR